MDTPRNGRANRKNEILDAFTGLVAERGYDDVSLRDVATQLGISKGTILHHFGSKDRLLEQLHAGYMRRRLAEAHEFRERFRSPTARLSAIVYHNMIAQRDDRAATRAFAREITRFASEPQLQHVRDMRDEYTAIVTSIVDAGIADGSFSPSDAAITTLQIHGMVNWSWTWYRPDGRLSPEQVAEAFGRTFVAGLHPRSRPIDEPELERVAEVVHEVMAAVSGIAPTAVSASSDRP
jgi:AcrR family transcriptional regulator